MLLQAIVLAIVVAALTIVGRSFDVSLDSIHVVAVSCAVGLMAFDFGLVTMALGAVSGRKTTGMAIGATLAAVSYLISSLAPVASWIRPARYFSPFYWSVGNDQITAGVSAIAWAYFLSWAWQLSRQLPSHSDVSTCTDNRWVRDCTSKVASRPLRGLVHGDLTLAKQQRYYRAHEMTTTNQSALPAYRYQTIE